MIIVMKLFRLAALIILAMGMQYPSYSQTTDVTPELTKLISIFSDNIPNGFGNDQDHFYLVEFGKDSTLVSRPRLGFDVLLIRYIETKHHPFTYKSFRIINNHKVYFYGKKNSFFSFNALNRVKLPEKSAEPLSIIDPSDYEWRICLFKDGSINEYLTERNIIHTGRDSVIDDIVPILKQPDPLVVEKWLSNYIFGSSTDVFLDYQAEPSPNEEGLFSIIRKYHFDTQRGFSSVTGLFNIDINGDAKFIGIKNEEYVGNNKEAICKICEEVERNIKFSPAIHRGRKVNSTYHLWFYSYLIRSNPQ